MIDGAVMDGGARRAWEELDGSLQRFISRRVPSAADAEDVRQDVLMRVQRNLPTLRDEQRLGPWVYRVARHAIVDYQRRRSRAMPTVADDEVPDTAISQHEESDAEQALAACIAPFIARLASPYREALVLTEIEGLSHREAAAMLEITLPAMKSRVLRGKERLRAMFEDCCKIALDARGRVLEYEPRNPRCSGGNGCG